MNLDELERLERDATEGPWKHETNAPDGEPAAMWHEHYVYAPNARYETLPGNTSPVKVAWLPQSPTKRPAHDAAFIAALRNSSRELIADARRMTFLEERGYAVDMLGDPDNDVRFWFGNGHTVSRARTLRAAIDFAIAQEQK